ncbi:hypothetical protein N431DRAFT_496594 [Stipitochalara longipes BDJ]|nr:hypothetical protein N431DRAFT_496594 [Stipitochalara longipes BDJ]
MSPRMRDLLEQLPKLAVNNLFLSPTFTCFPKLPIELRNKVWKQACFEQRTIIITIDTDSNYNRTFTGSLPNPSVLSVSFESRTEAKTHYTLCLQGLDDPRTSPQIALGVHVNFNVDRFSISQWSNLWPETIFGFWRCQDAQPRPIPHTFSPEFFKKIRFLDAENNLNRGRYRWEGILAIANHPGLIEFNVVAKEPPYAGNIRDRKDSVGRHLWATEKQNLMLKELKITVARFGEERKVDVSSLVVDCKWKKIAYEEADLPPAPPEDRECSLWDIHPMEMIN